MPLSGDLLFCPFLSVISKNKVRTRNQISVNRDARIIFPFLKSHYQLISSPGMTGSEYFIRPVQPEDVVGYSIYRYSVIQRIFSQQSYSSSTSWHDLIFPNQPNDTYGGAGGIRKITSSSSGNSRIGEHKSNQNSSSNFIQAALCRSRNISSKLTLRMRSSRFPDLLMLPEKRSALLYTFSTSRRGQADRGYLSVPS
jgi:hypothetical protein